MLPDLDAQALRSGSRELGALGERCGELAAQLHRGGDALTGGPRSWSGSAARASGERAAALGTALGQATTATTEAAAVLAAVATAVEDAQATWQHAQRLAASTGSSQGAGGLGGPEMGAAGLGGLVGDDLDVRAALGSASAAFDELAGRAPALCRGVGRWGAFARVVEVSTHGPISPWDDVRDGLVSGVKGMVEGGVHTAVLAWPLYWVVRPADARRRVHETAAGGLAALRDPATAVRRQLGTDDLENGHAWRFWSRLLPEAALAAVAKGAGSIGRAAGAGGQAATVARGMPLAGTAAGRAVARGSAPLGFGGPAEFEQFGARLGAGLREAGYGDVRAAFQGSAVTGRDYLSGAPFDVGRRSDFDVALGGESLFERARSIGVGLRSGGTRTAPLTRAQLDALGLEGLAGELARLTGRPVAFMVYKSIEEAAVRHPSIMVPLG